MSLLSRLFGLVILLAPLALAQPLQSNEACLSDSTSLMQVKHAVSLGAGRSTPDYHPPPGVGGGILESEIGVRHAPPAAGDEIPAKMTTDEVQRLNHPSKDFHPVKDLGKALNDVLGMGGEDAAATGASNIVGAPEDLDAGDATKESENESQIKGTATEEHKHTKAGKVANKDRTEEDDVQAEEQDIMKLARKYARAKQAEQRSKGNSTANDKTNTAMKVTKDHEDQNKTQDAGSDKTQADAVNSADMKTALDKVKQRAKEAKENMTIFHWAKEMEKNSTKSTTKMEEGKTVEASLFLDEVRDTITGSILKTPSILTEGSTGYAGDVAHKKLQPYNETSRWRGDTWCSDCFSMAGGARVQNVRELVEKTIIDNVPGDFLEAGTWRGGNSIMARVVQKVMGEGDTRNTYVCDSFQGIPQASSGQDTDAWSQMDFLRVSQEEVEDNFKRFHALDDHVKFRKGYFNDTLPKLKDELIKEGRTLAVLRGDGDMYESYMDILYNLYDLLQVGGYFICDDCPTIKVAQDAVDAFRTQNGISEPIQRINGSSFGSYWKKESPANVRYSTYLKWNTTRSFELRSKDNLRDAVDPSHTMTWR